MASRERRARAWQRGRGRSTTTCSAGREPCRLARPVRHHAGRCDDEEPASAELAARRAPAASGRASAASCPGPCRRRGCRRGRCPTGSAASGSRRAGRAAASRERRPAARRGSTRIEVEQRPDGTAHAFGLLLDDAQCGELVPQPGVNRPRCAGRRRACPAASGPRRSARAAGPSSGRSSENHVPLSRMRCSCAAGDRLEERRQRHVLARRPSTEMPRSNQSVGAPSPGSDVDTWISGASTASLYVAGSPTTVSSTDGSSSSTGSSSANATVVNPCSRVSGTSRRMRATTCHKGSNPATSWTSSSSSTSARSAARSRIGSCSSAAIGTSTPPAAAP